jgi:signal peptidase I
MTTVPTPPEADAATPRERRRGKRAPRRPWPVWVHLILALVLVALLRNFVAQSFYVPSGSMIPTLAVGDRMVVSRIPTTLHRGDIVVFDGTTTFGGNPGPRFDSTIGKVLSAGAKVFGIDVNERDYVKRIVGLPGDHVVCCDAQHRIIVNDKPLAEPYLAPGMAPSLMDFDVRVPAGRLWLMGDNRSNSADSRAHLGDPGGGMVPESDVIGKPLLRYWPFSRFGTLPSAEQPAVAGG